MKDEESEQNEAQLRHFVAAIQEGERAVHGGRTYPAEIVFQELKAKHGLTAAFVEQDKDVATPPELTEYSIEGSGSISLRYFMTASAESSYEDILVVRYVGKYPPGSVGNLDARYMYAMATAAIATFEPRGVIHDLTELRYEWGDMLELVFNAVPVLPINCESETPAMAAVVGANCEEAVRTLLLSIDSEEPIEKIGWVFRDLTDAWRYVSGKMTEDELRLASGNFTMDESERRELLIRRAYAAFNVRDIDGVLATLRPDVEWPASTEGSGYVRGHNAVRGYWTLQWATIDPHVEPLGFKTDAAGRVVVEVHQIVRDLSGALLADMVVHHAYRFDGDLVAHMEILP